MSPPQHNLTHTLQYNAYNFVAVLWYSYGIELIAILSTSSQALARCACARPHRLAPQGLASDLSPYVFGVCCDRGVCFKLKNQKGELALARHALATESLLARGRSVRAPDRRWFLPRASERSL